MSVCNQAEQDLGWLSERRTGDNDAHICKDIPDELVSIRISLSCREAGVLVTQLFIAAYIRHLSRRKIFWLTGALLSAASLICTVLITSLTEGILDGLHSRHLANISGYHS
jgi:hypothetical protein